MVGCIQPTKHHKDSPGKGTVWSCAGLSKAKKDKVWQTVEKEARALIDDGQMDLQYVVLYELAINDSNSFYLIKDSYIPAYEYNYPSKSFLIGISNFALSDCMNHPCLSMKCFVNLVILPTLIWNLE